MNDRSGPKAASKSIPADYGKPTNRPGHFIPRSAARRERRRDAWFDLHVEPERPRPSTYGMTSSELRDYAAQLQRDGWQAWEIRARLADPRKLAAA